LFQGESKAINAIFEKIKQVAKVHSTVLVLGETGTGKELVARAIHDLSSRKEHPTITVNCAALPATLVEAELFGREKGAHTGATTRQAGRFETADRSTIFLDEIGDLPFDLQVKVLRVLQEGQFERLGSSKTIKVNVRLIGATNRDLEKAVDEGRSRRDLYYRLNVFPIRVPALRERLEDTFRMDTNYLYLWQWLMDCIGRWDSLSISIRATICYHIR
jgi:formate hydrogenlyase transcriptional activator